MGIFFQKHASVARRHPFISTAKDLTDWIPADAMPANLHHETLRPKQNTIETKYENESKQTGIGKPQGSFRIHNLGNGDDHASLRIKPQ